MPKGDGYAKIDVTRSKVSSRTLRMLHQQDAVDSLNKHFNINNPEKGQNGLLVMPTGERVRIVMGAVCVMQPRVLGTLDKYISCIA